jgi:opacity protein-like surface antigen
MHHRIYCLLTASIASPGLAADIDNSWLRGSSSFPADPPPFARWNGLYAGGQIGEDFHGFDFGGTGVNQLSVLNTKGPSVGGFMGYNYQIDDIVAGFEFNFNSSSVQASSSEGVTNSAAATINDYGTARMRFAWVYGSFLPYAFGGMSASQINASRIFTSPGGLTQTDVSHGKWTFGFDAGLAACRTRI